MCKKLVICKYLQYKDAELHFSPETYPYVVDTVKPIKEGDFIVIKDPVGGSNSDRKYVSVVKVIKTFEDADSVSAQSYLSSAKCARVRDKIFLGKADIGPYFEEIEKAHKRAEIKEKLEARFKEVEKDALYRKLAETDPTMKVLLDELDKLDV